MPGHRGLRACRPECRQSRFGVASFRVRLCRQDGLVEGYVKHGSKQYMVVIERRGRGGSARCGCEDAVKRGVLCKHIAFAAMSELGLAAAARSAHRQLQVLGR
ncbi:hypothetical protein B0537_14980 [Desulforamulus ferrireducens]|uniref:SWIM-type domain-containing protein n=2 Tax=Desulforamulus ferrireducens TaxID=1833852 RepID=A0A1S6J0U5_9FIRM|nr:hypothetical protein B0537_14980 [Desulforamulus ferrireducens]